VVNALNTMNATTLLPNFVLTGIAYIERRAYFREILKPAGGFLRRTWDGTADTINPHGLNMRTGRFCIGDPRLANRSERWERCRKASHWQGLDCSDLSRS
jgi:hypothetical protein